jgi:hypothetical protein
LRRKVASQEVSGKDGGAIEVEAPVATTADRAKALAALIARAIAEKLPQL